MGGFFYIVGSCWDLNLSNSGRDPQNVLFYNSIWILGPMVYLLNSFIDVIWALRAMHAEKKQRGEFIIWKRAIAHIHIVLPVLAHIIIYFT